MTSAITVLCIDDDPGILDLLTMVVNQLGYQAEVAMSGGEAKDILSRRPPRLILMDVMMPDITGVELCRWVRSQDGLEVIPVIMVTALRDEETAHDTMEAGATDYVVKPFHLDELKQKIQKVLKVTGGS